MALHFLRPKVLQAQHGRQRPLNGRQVCLQSVRLSKRVPGELNKAREAEREVGKKKKEEEGKKAFQERHIVSNKVQHKDYGQPGRLGSAKGTQKAP